MLERLAARASTSVQVSSPASMGCMPSGLLSSATRWLTYSSSSVLVGWAGLSWLAQPLQEDSMRSTPMTTTIAPEFLIQRQGRTLILYAGLLDAAHRSAGLRSIRTTLIQAPTDANGQLAVCAAEVTTEDGRMFSGI